jgi:Uma2 family endonuclease
MNLETHRSVSHDDEHPATDRDQYVRLNGIPWEIYEALVDARGDGSPRMTYLDGALELMSPGRPHEDTKATLTGLVARWAELKGVFLHGIGVCTIRRKKKKSGGEPDASYFVDKRSIKRHKRPAIAVEVVSSSGALDKLEVWRRIAVPEVWVWHKQHLEFHVLDEKHYRRVPRSVLVPDLDPQLIEECMAKPQPEALALLERIATD